MSKNMYESGELDLVMDSFEKTLKGSGSSLYISGSSERAELVEENLPSGLLSYRYKNNNYYNNGHINQLFIAYLHGYARGKCEGLQQ